MSNSMKSITLQSVSFFVLIAMNPIGQGEPDAHDEHNNNQFLDTRGLPALATGMKAQDILMRVADASKPLGTRMEIKGDVGEIAISAGR